MKRFFLVAVLTIAGYTLFSQTIEGILTCNIPKGWVIQQGNDQTVLYSKEHTDCKIVFFKAVQTAIISEKIFNRYLQEFLLNKQITPAVTQKTTGTGWVSFAGGFNGTKDKTAPLAFYSLSDNTQTLCWAVYADPGEVCLDDLEMILDSVNLTKLQSGSNSQAKTKKKGIKICALKTLKAMVN